MNEQPLWREIPPFDCPEADPELTDTVTGRDYVSVDSLTGAYVSREGNTVFLDAQEPILSLCGLPLPKDNKGEYYRLDAFHREKYPERVALLAEETSGVTVRFCTNAPFFVLKAAMRNVDTIEQNPLFPVTGAVGFDVYAGRGAHSKLLRTILNPEGFTEEIALPDGYQDVTVVFPVYAGVTEVKIGLPCGAEIAKSTPRRFGTVAIYGPSIAQGACVTRPSLNYANTLCRVMDADCRNLGFSGAALGEQVIAEFLASQEGFDAFVLDYDWNAYHAEHLANTHYAFYQTVRKAHPHIPFVMLSRPVFSPNGSEEDRARCAVIRASYERAVAEGDTNLYFLSGSDFYTEVFGTDAEPLCMCDGVHPNDSGHYFMAKAIYEVLRPHLVRK